MRLPERENLERFVCGVSRSRTFLSILSFHPLLKHTPPPTHHPLFTNFAINGSHQGQSLLSLPTIFHILLIFLIVLVVPRYLANRTQIDWRWLSFNATFTFMFQLTIFVFFLLSIQEKHLVNNSQPRLLGRLHRYVTVVAVIAVAVNNISLNFFLSILLIIDRHWRSQEAPQIPSWYRRSSWDQALPKVHWAPYPKASIPEACSWDCSGLQG